jgi:hypothetical protein
MWENDDAPRDGMAIFRQSHVAKWAMTSCCDVE